MKPAEDPADIRGPFDGVLDRTVLALQHFFALVERVQHRKARHEPGDLHLTAAGALATQRHSAASDRH